MASLEEIRSVAKLAASGTLNAEIVDVQVETATGMDGDELVRVVLVLPDEAIDLLTDDSVLATLLAVKRGVRDIGDPRHALIGYTTPSELVDDGDPES